MTQLLRNMSPLIQKITALLLFVLLCLCTLQMIFWPLWTAAQQQVSALNDARFEHSRFVALDKRPLSKAATSLRSDFVMPQIDGAERPAVLMQYIERKLTGVSLNIQTVQPSAEQSKLAAVNVVWEGRQETVTRLIADLEASAPLIRFEAWQIEAVPEQPGVIRFSAKIIAAVGKV